MRDVLRFRSENPDLLVGCALASGVLVAPSPPGLLSAIDRLLAARAAEDPAGEERRRAVRDLLRFGGFKPTGRNKPASEYLARAARECAFPRVSNVVDAANRFSLETGYPLSLLDLDRAIAGDARLEVREGRAGESFVFNPAGQSIQVAGLVSVAREGGVALANPVKDGMATKVDDATKRVLGILYLSRRVATPEEAMELARGLASELAEAGAALEAEAWVLP